MTDDQKQGQEQVEQEATASQPMPYYSLTNTGKRAIIIERLNNIEIDLFKAELDLGEAQYMGANEDDEAPLQQKIVYHHTRRDFLVNLLQPQSQTEVSDDGEGQLRFLAEGEDPENPVDPDEDLMQDPLPDQGDNAGPKSGRTKVKPTP